MAILNKVVYLTEAQKTTLFSTGTVTANGITVTYSPNDIYITPQTIDTTVTSGSSNLVTSGAVAAAIPTVPTVISAFTNDAGYITSADVPEGASAYTGTITSVGTTKSSGTNNGFARGDHQHDISLATGDNNGEIKIAGTNVSVKGLGSNAYTSTAYLPLAGGTMTGGVTFVGHQSSAWNDKGIIFTDGSRIGENTSGQLGLYSANTFYLRPNSGSASSGKGIEISDTYLISSADNEMALGNSAHKWAYVYSNKYNTPTQSAGYTNGIRFINGTTDKGSIGCDTSGILGIYASSKVCLRPVLNAATDGVEITTSSMIPTKNATMSLGDSSHKWTTVYAATFDGNATTATNISGNKNANTVLAGPSSGNAASPSFRTLVAADIPDLAWSKITSGNDDLKAIENLTGTSGLLKKTAANTWTLDTTTYAASSHTHYWANIAVTSAASYNAAPEMATLKLNGNTAATAASTANVVLVYNSTTQALNFTFA